jgi:antitoxin CptB
MENIEIFRKKLLYKASHRGTKEMDILMGNFADKFIQLFDDHELSLLDILLDQDDDHIYKIILKKTPIQENIDNRVTKLLIDFANTINE